MVVRRSYYLILLLGLFCGCLTREEVDETDADLATETQISPPDDSLRVIGASMFREELAKHVGQVVLVDMWATW